VAEASVSRTISHGDVEVVETFWDAIDLLNITHTLAACADHEPFAVLGAGVHNFDFAFPITVFVPPSFKCSNMSVRYMLKAELAVPGLSRRAKVKAALFSPGTYDCTLFTPLGMPLSINSVKDEKRFFMAGGDCILTVQAPSAVRQGERALIVCKINNFTNKTINSITIKMVSTVWCVLRDIKRTAAVRRWGRQTFPEGATGKMSQKVVEIGYDVPECLVSLNIDDLMFIDNFLHVQVDVSFAGNLRVKLPIFVTTALPLRGDAVATTKPVYTVVSGTGAKPTDKAFGEFDADTELPEQAEVESDDKAAPATAAPPVTVLAPRESRLRGDTVVAATTMPAGWAATSDRDMNEVDGMVQCFHPGCGAYFPTKSALQAHSIAIHTVTSQ
jgi:hypothetical protein